MRLGSGAYEGKFSFVSRFENGDGTNPEELIAAAHAGCFSMAFSNALAKAGFTPTSVKTSATVHLDKGAAGFGITRIDLDTVGEVPGIERRAVPGDRRRRQGQLPGVAGPEGGRHHAERQAGIDDADRSQRPAVTPAFRLSEALTRLPRRLC